MTADTDRYRAIASAIRLTWRNGLPDIRGVIFAEPLKSRLSRQ